MNRPSKFVTKEAWGSTLGRQATPRTHPIGATKGVTIHWEGPTMGSFPHSQCAGKVRSIERFHEQTRGWADLAYSGIVCPHGYVFEGRGVGTQTAANGSSDDNDDYYALCYLGGQGDPFTDAGKVGFIEGVQWLRSEGDAGREVNGHRDHKSTECPGDVIYRWLQTANFSTDPTPTPAPVTSHTRWAIRTTGVHDAPGGTKLRDIPPGYSFSVIDGSGHGNDGWIQTTHRNWVLGRDTTTRDPALPVRFSVMDWNVENKGDADAALDRAEIIKLCADRKPTYFCLQEVYRVDLSDIPGYQTYQAFEGYSADSENRAQAILVRDDVALKIKQALQMTEEWTGPKMGIEKDPRVHRYVVGNLYQTNLPVATMHVPFPDDGDRAPIEETRLAAIEWLKTMEKAHGCGVIAADWNSLADGLQAKVGTPAGATVYGSGLDKFVGVGVKLVKIESLGNRGRSDHPVKVGLFEA